MSHQPKSSAPWLARRGARSARWPGSRVARRRSAPSASQAASARPGRQRGEGEAAVELHASMSRTLAARSRVEKGLVM